MPPDEIPPGTLTGGDGKPMGTAKAQLKTGVEQVLSMGMKWTVEPVTKIVRSLRQ